MRTTHRGTEAPRQMIRGCARRIAWLNAAMLLVWLPAPVHAQQLLDRVVARVKGSPITLADVRAAIALGVVDVKAGEDAEVSAARQLVDRELVLAEAGRFPPPEPSAADIEKQVNVYKARVGDGLPALMQSTGIDERRLQQLARATLRMQTYLGQRFGTGSAVPDEDVQQYYLAHPAEFTRNGRLLPLADIEPEARAAASAERRRTTISLWLRELRGRADVIEVPGPAR
jgi:hypothetical protein